MQFKDILGQPAITATLVAMAKTSRLPHALMLMGAPGSGKLALAIALAQYMFCESPLKGDSCGNCRNCSRVNRLVHPDLHFVYPVVGNKITSSHFAAEWRSAITNNPYLNINQWLQQIGAENKQGNINKDECVQIVQKLFLKAFEGKYKIMVLWLPEYLGKEGNRLLKIIEEPPPDTFFFFVAEQPELILNTILSRCQIIRINPLSDEDIVRGLMTREGLSQHEAEGIAQIADGNYNEALLLASQQQNDQAQLFLDWLRKCYKGNGVELVRWVEKFAVLGRENQKHFFRYALHFLHEYMHLKVAGHEQLRLRPQELKAAKNMSKLIGFDQIQELVILFDECFYYIERNANPKVLLLDTSIQVNEILRDKVSLEA